MQQLHYSLKLLTGCILSLSLWALTIHQANAQAGDICSSATVIPDLTVSDYLNQVFDAPLGIIGTDAVPCLPTALTIDGWARFTAPSTGSYTIQYTTNSVIPVAHDAILVVYRDLGGGCGALTPLACVNNFVNQTGTESAVINANAGETIFIRVGTDEDLLGADLQGILNVFKGTNAEGDLCADALSIDIGTCDFDFDVEARFFNNEGREDNGSCTGFVFDPALDTNNDGWLVFEANSGRVGVEYTNLEGDAALEIYRGSCGNLTFVAGTCTNDIVGLGTETVELDVVSGFQYYIRVMNIAGSTGMRGGLCLYEVSARDFVTAATTAPKVSLGDCNVKINVLQGFSATPYTAGALPAGCTATGGGIQPDAWVVYEATANVDVVLEYSSVTGQSPSMLVFENLADPANIDASTELATRVNDDGSLTDACVPPSGKSVRMTLRAIAGSTYYIQIINPTGTDMLGGLCMYQSLVRGEDSFVLAKQYALDGSNCGEQFNVLGNFNADGDSHLGADISCSLGSSQRDAWARFQTGATLENLIIEYSNDNNDPLLANDVSLLLYNGGAVNTVADQAQDICDNAVQINLDQPTTLNLPLSFASEALGEAACDPLSDAWVYFIADGNPFTVVYESTNQDASFELYEGLTCGTMIPFPLGTGSPICTDNSLSTEPENFSLPSSTLPITPPLAGTKIYVRVVNKTSTLDMLGKITVFRLNQISCANLVAEEEEGTERLEIPSTSLVANNVYFVRVVNTSSESSTTGSLCVREDVIPEGDICSTAIPALVGDCDVNFDLLSTFGLNQTGINPTCLSSLGGNYRDGWMRFTATAASTTIQYLNDSPGTDAAIALYRGSCGASLIFLGCANDVATNTKPEALKIATIPGVEYFIQIIDRNNVAAGMTGRFCIFNTTERDICDDNELVTKVVGDCSIQLDVPANFDIENGTPIEINPPFRDYTAVAQLTADGITRIDKGCDVLDHISGGTTNLFTTFIPSRDAWMRFIGNGNEITLTYQNKEATSNPALVVYTAIAGPGPIDCSFGLNGAGNTLNQLACADTARQTAGVSSAGIQTESLSFQSEAGRVYLLRLIDVGRDATNDGMTGILCIADGSQDYNDCAEAREISVGQCSVPINVINEVNTCSVDTDADILSVDCLSGGPESVFPANSVWSYLNNPTAAPPADGEGDNWTQLNYNDAAWLTGNGAFGFPNTETSVSTLLPNNAGIPYRTYYFRRRFDASTGPYSALTIRLRRDDGAVIYVNGVEVARDRMPAGAINHNTNAISCLWGSQETDYFTVEVPVTPGLLNYASGDNNVITVELHNCDATNGDAVFDLELTGTLSGGVTCTGSEADAWAKFTVPLQCDPKVDPVSATITYTGSGTLVDPFVGDCGAPNLVANPGANGLFNPADVDANADVCSCIENSVKSLPDTKITVQYDNRNFTLDDAADVAMAIFKANDCAGINNAVVPSPLVGCTDVLETGEEGLEEITINGVTFGETYFVRLVNRDSQLTSLGKLCVLWGETLAQAQCPPSNTYGELDGEFKDFEVLGAWKNETNIPTRTIPSAPGDAITAAITTDYDVPCVLPGGSKPASNSPNPIRSQGWMRFEVPAGFASDENTNAVTVQYDNSGFGSNNPQNAAIAVYIMPNRWTDGIGGNCAAYNFSTPFSESAPANPNIDGLQILGCINAVFDGSESLTVPIPDTTVDLTYFVRVMNVTSGSGTAANMPGRIRVFPFAPCTVGANLVSHGDFDNWPAIVPNQNPLATTGDYDTYMDAWIHTNPLTTGANRTSFIEQYARFATDYGYVRDKGSGTGNDNNATNTYQYLFLKRGELNPEGLYAVSQSPWSYKSDWYCYGQGYSGYGGSLGNSGHSPSAPNAAYCNTGNPNAFDADNEPCVPIPIPPGTAFTTGTFGSFEAGKPALIPTTEDANFMIVNGSFNPASNLPPGKVWCQTVNRGASAEKVTYYVFSVWVQNMISASRNLDVPLLRMTVCDMEDPNNPGELPALGATGTVEDVNGPISGSPLQTRLPGITNFILTEGPTKGNTVHNPPIPNSYKLEQSIVNGGRQQPYGAAMPCNLPDENRDFRLKVLGQSFLITERPDQWQLIRCIYRAPAGVIRMNVCLENLSLTKNGNDFGIDNIQFQECTNSELNAEQFELLLKGDACELATGPEQLRLQNPLKVEMLDFTGKLIGDAVYLDWLVLSEANVKSYEVQRSLNGTDFFAIGTVDAKGNASTLTQYEFTDRNLPENQNYLYYRLKMQSNDGVGQLGPVVRIPIMADNEEDMQLIPNPTLSGDEVEVRFNVPAGQVMIDVTSLMGVRLLNQGFTAQNGENSVMIDTKGFPNGIYIARLTYQDASGKIKRIAKRFVVVSNK
ncbi:MAG: T9SS type A sorting domain-containing protein [Microscillaceae bacterium]|nr:T9SS type A sorting domain-containing protein [Microscillaceae bacterium]